MQWKRRDWFKQLGSVFAWVALPVGAKAAVADEPKPVPLATTPPPDPGTIRESYELIVVGGGIAGTSAAISAARNGVKVALVHERSMLGGNSSSEVKLFPENGAGHQPWIKEGGIHEEFHTAFFVLVHVIVIDLLDEHTNDRIKQHRRECSWHPRL